MNTFTIDQISQIFADAMIDVLSTSTGLDFIVSDDGSDSSLDDLVSFLSLYGENNGMLFASASDSTARTLCAQMTGSKVADVDTSDIEDALCELTNMAAGNAKLRFNNANTVYTLSPLFAIRGREMTLMTKKRVNLVSKTLKCDNISVILKVVFF